MKVQDGRELHQYSNQLTLHRPAPADLLKLYRIFVFLVTDQAIYVAIPGEIYNVSFLCCSEHAIGARVFDRLRYSQFITEL